MILLCILVYICFRRSLFATCCIFMHCFMTVFIFIVCRCFLLFWFGFFNYFCPFLIVSFICIDDLVWLNAYIYIIIYVDRETNFRPFMALEWRCRSLQCLIVNSSDKCDLHKHSEQNANKANSVLDVLLLAVSKPLVCLNQLVTENCSTMKPMCVQLSLLLLSETWN